MRVTVLLVLTFFGSAVFAQDNAVLIRSSFSRLKNAFAALNGKQAVELVDNNTLAYYYNAFREAKSLDSIQVEHLPAYEKALVFDMRMHANTAGMNAVNARSCFIYAMDNGWVTRWGVLTTIAMAEVGDLTLEKDSATVSLLLNGMKLPYRLRFRHETSQWRADLTVLCAFTSQMYKQLAQNMKVSETKAVLFMMGTLPDDKPDPVIWKPLVIQ